MVPPPASAKEAEKEEEEQELFVGDSVRLVSSADAVKLVLAGLSLKWDPSISQFLGHTGSIVKVDVKDGKQIVSVQFGGSDGATLTLGAAALEVQEEEDDIDDDQASQAGEESDDAEESGAAQVFQVNDKVRDITRVQKGKMATGIISKAEDGKCSVKYDDGTTRTGVPVAQLRPAQKATQDGSGFCGADSFNEFDFTRNQLPTGVEAVGEGVELRAGRGGETFLYVRKGTFLKVPLRGLRHERLHVGEPVPCYSLTLEMQLGEAHARLAHPWSLFQASFPEVHETDEVSITSQTKPVFPKWKVGTDVDKLKVQVDSSQLSAKILDLKPGTEVQQCGEIMRLPNGVRRMPIKFKRARSGDDDEPEEKPVPAPKKPGGADNPFGLFGEQEEEYVDAGYGGKGGYCEEQEVEIEVHAGFWGEPREAPGAPTSVKVASNGTTRTLTFHPGVPGGAARIDGEPITNIGWTPEVGRYHILHLTMRQTGVHEFSIHDGANPTMSWKHEFRLQGWLDDIYGSAGVTVSDAEDRELDLGVEVTCRAEGEHRLRLAREGSRIFETDELDPRGWVTFSRTALEPVDFGAKVVRGPTCHVKVKDKTVEKRLSPGHWHSVTFTVDGMRDEMQVYIDGVPATSKAIDLLETTMKLPRRRGGAREGEDGQGMGSQDGGGYSGGYGGSASYGASYSSSYGGGYGGYGGYGSGGYGGYGGYSPSPYAVPQEGFLLFASSSMRGMPGGVKLRRAVFRNSVLEASAVEELFVNSRHRRRAPPLSPDLALAPVLKRRAPPLWLHGSFVAEFCNPFVPAAGGQPLQLFQIFCLALEGTLAKLEDAGWAAAEVSGCRRVLALCREAEPLYRKWQQLWLCADAEQLPALSQAYIRRLAQAREELQAGGRLLVPLGLRSGRDQQALSLLLEKKASGNYRFIVVNSSEMGLAYHTASAAEPPKIKYQAALELDDIPPERAEDEAWWLMLVVTAVQPCGDGPALYDKLLPWLAGAPLEHILVEQASRRQAAGGSADADAVAEWRTPQCARTDAWRSLTFVLRVLLGEVAGVSRARAKLFKWHFRRQMLSLAAHDLSKVRALSVSERRLLRNGLSQLSLGAVKVSGLLCEDSAQASPLPLLHEAQNVVKEVEEAIKRKPRPYGFEDPTVLPLLDLVAGAEEAPAEEWGLYPFFDRLLREQRSPGTKAGVPMLVPINLLQLPERVNDLEGAVEALRLCEQLCAKLSFVGTERCKFSPFLKVALLQHVFTELLPVPLGPIAERPPLSLTDPIWAPTGSQGVHPQLTRGGQLELMQLLGRLAEHFSAAVASIKASKGFDGVKIVVLGAIAAMADRVLRTRVRQVADCKPEEHPSEISELINGIGRKGWRPLAVDPVAFLLQSETIEIATPELSIVRTAVASYFSEVIEALGVKRGTDETLFDWDLHGWMLWVNKEKGLRRLVQMACAKHLLETGAQWFQFAVGGDRYLTHVWPEFAAYRDIIFWWKYFLCTDLRVFPNRDDFKPQAAYLTWSVADEQKAFGSPPNKGKVFVVSALGKDHLMKHAQVGNRPKPPSSGHRWPSSALPSQYTKLPVRTEDDLLYMRTLPTFNEMLRASDAEALLSFLTVPYIRMPLVLAFFTTGDRVNSLFEKTLQELLQAVVLEPGRLLEPKRWGESPSTVPAVSSAELELIATPYGQLLTELACAPACICADLAKLMELALVLANSAMSQTVTTILFVARVAARVESSICLLLRHADGRLPSGGPLPGSLPATPAALAELRAGRRRLRQLFTEAEEWLDAWLEELQGLAQRAAQHTQELSGGAAGAKKAKEAAQAQLDEYMRRSCNIHAHVLLLLRNVSEDELDERTVGRFLSSFAFLSLHHTFNSNFLDFPEPELFEVYQHHRRGLVRWFEKQQRGREYKSFNRVLQQVHQQFATIDAANAVETSQFEWGAIGGDARNAGRFCIVGPARSDAERGHIPVVKPEEASWIELNVQLLQVTVRGRHVTPLENDACENGDFQTVLQLGSGQQAQTVQCAALLSTNLVRVRELLSQPFRVTLWQGMGADVLPYVGDYVRLYDLEDFQEHESWIPQLFEPVRLQFFVRPAVPQDILFFMLEETDPEASIVVLVGVHPKIRGKIWKEVILFRDLRMVQIFGIESYGFQLYRCLEYTTDSRYTLAEGQPSINDREDPWPDWGRYEAGGPKLQPEDRPPSVVLTRTIIRDTGGDGSCGAGTRRSDPLDDEAEWSDGEPSDDETEAERKQRTVWERCQREGEQFLPARVLSGLLPEAILAKYRIYQENEPPARVLRGYPLTPEGEEDENPDHIIEIKLVKVAKVPETRSRGWCGLIRKRFKAPGRKPRHLLNLLCAREGTPLHSLARMLVRLEDLSHILAWTETDPHGRGVDPSIDLIELPRLLLSFVVRHAPDGSRGLWSLDHAELSVPVGPHTAARAQAARLLMPLPHGVLLQTKNQEFYAMVPNVKVHRPHVQNDPFSTELVLERADDSWWEAAKNKTFLFPVHASQTFLQTPTRASALYLMLLRWMNRDYGGVASLVSAVGTDTRYEDDEMQIFKHTGTVKDPHPDSHANRMKVTLAVADAGMRWPWIVLEEAAFYLKKITHVSARSRLSMDEELRLLELTSQIRKTMEIVDAEVSLLKARFWGEWGALKLKRYAELLSSPSAEKNASYQEVKEIDNWIRQLLKKLRAAQLPGTKDDVKREVLRAFNNESLPAEAALTLDNRATYLGRLTGTDGAKAEDPLLLTCPQRPKQTLWQTHVDQNVLLCSLFDLMWEVLGAEKVLRRDVDEEEGPEIPMMRRLPFPMALTTAFEICQGKMSLQDYGKAKTTFAFMYSLFTRSTGARLGRQRETQPAHQHTFSLLLLHLMPGGRFHGVLASLLHVLAQNPGICDSMPLLTQPKKVRLVKQWKLKLTEIHGTVVKAANALQLQWPPSPEAYQEMPAPMQSKVALEWLAQPPASRGLCPRLLFCPEVSRVGAAVRGCPTLTALTCTTRFLCSSADLSTEDAAAFASRPLQALHSKYLLDVDPSERMDEAMPFDISGHPMAKHRVARSMLSRLEHEVALCAKMRNARRKPVLSRLQAEHVKAIVAGDAAVLAEARLQLESLLRDLVELKAHDDAFIAKAIRSVQDAANEVDLSEGPGERDRLRFWLLRYVNLEAPLWFEHLCCGLLSPSCESDFQQANPFLPKEASAKLLETLAQMMLSATRVVHVCRCLDSAHGLLELLNAPQDAGSTAALEAGLSEKANGFCGVLSSKRTFISPTEEGAGVFRGRFDPRYLLFEFITGFLLRPRQVEMVDEFSRTLHGGQSVVKQMIMGAGKTSVVSPLLALMFADGQRLVCLVVPQALVGLSRSVLQSAFSTVVQKRVSTFKCDRSVDLEVGLSGRMQRVCAQGDIVLSTPGDIKSLELRFLEQLDLANDRRARKNTPQMRRECVEMGRTLELLKSGICMIDEVDLVLHPLRSELNFPIGPKSLIEHSPERWRIALHLLDGFFSVEKGRVPPHLRDSLRATEILNVLGAVIRDGCNRRYLQRSPHLVLLNEEFYHNEVKPIMCEWLGLWLSSEHVGRVFEQGSEQGDRGISDDEVRAYIQHRVTPLHFEAEAPLEKWRAGLSRSASWLLDVVEGRSDFHTGALEIMAVELPCGPVPRSEYQAALLPASKPGHVHIKLSETAEGAEERGRRVERLPAKDVKSMNLSFDWLHIYLPFCLRKIDRVTFGIMSAEQVAAALAEQPLMPLTRAKLAIPFVGKDVPSQSSEFAHPDVVIGLTVLAYRYEGLRRDDFDEVLGMLCDQLETENGMMMERPTSLLWRSWVEEAGAIFCVKQAELDDKSAEDILEVKEGHSQLDRHKPRVLPLHLLERRNSANMKQLFELMRRLPLAVHFYLERSIFPAFMRFQDEKLSASGQDLGGSILFGQRIGFSGTPSDLMPVELGQCDYEPGSEGEMVSTMTDPRVVAFEAVEPGWGVASLLDSIIAAARTGRCSALIDTGALITGLTNREVAEYLLGFGRARQGDDSPARQRPTLPESIDGVVFLDDDGGKKILLRQTREVTKLADSGVPAQKRFAFYDQVHTTGMDIAHKLDAVAALTLGKDMTWRDYVQGAYRMRGIGRGQQICLYVIPEVVELITKDLRMAGIESALGGGDAMQWTSSLRGRLLAVAAWLLVNSIRTERIQFAMLQLQNLGNVWRRNAFARVMTDFELVTSEDLRRSVAVFKEPIAFSLPSRVPRPRGVQEVVEERIELMREFIDSEPDKELILEIQYNVKEVAELGDEKEGEAGLETEQEREQEQERQQEQEQEEEREQEIEIEKFVDLMHCRDDEEPESWDIATLGSQSSAKQFYPASRFCLWKRRPLTSITPEARLSCNWFNPQWSGFRRVKSVFVQLEWSPDLSQAIRASGALALDAAEEAEMHKKLRSVWDLLIRTPGLDGPASDALSANDDAKVKEIGSAKLRELLSASFDWDQSLHDPVSALAALGKRKDESIGYDEMVQLLLDARFRTRDDGRFFVLLSLAEAETLRRVLHARIGRPLLERAPDAAVALRCVFANHSILDMSHNFRAGPTFQCRMLHQLARFFDGQTFYRPPELSVLLRAIQQNRPFDRRRFFEGLGSCRRRASLANWDQQPVAEVLRPWLEFEQVLTRIRAVRLHSAIYGQGLSVQMAFQRYDINHSGLLEPMELCRALHELGFAFDASEVANWIEAVDTNGDNCADYPEFFAFCKLQVDALMGSGGARAAAAAVRAEDTARAAALQNGAMVRVPEQPPAMERATSQPAALPATPCPLERSSSAPESGGKNFKPPERVTSPSAEQPSELAMLPLMRATSDIVRPEDIEEELMERRAISRRQEAEEARAKAEEEDAIDVLIEEELGTNPYYGDGYAEWDFRGQLLPKDTFALGVVDLIPESWGAPKGRNFLLFDRRAGLSVQRILMAPNGDSSQRINRYSLTLWFRSPVLPSKADRMLLLDIPRGDMDPDVGEAKNGSVFIWRGGVIAPEGYHEPTLMRKKASSSEGASIVSGEWQLTFRGDGGREQLSEVTLAVEPSGRLLVQPSRGAAARRRDATADQAFGVKLRMQAEVTEIVENQYDGAMPDDFKPIFTQLFNQKIKSVLNMAAEGRGWSELGFSSGLNQIRRKMERDLKTKGEVLLARGLDGTSAVRLARELRQYSKGGAMMTEDHSLEKEPKKGDKVRLAPGASNPLMKQGDIGEVQHLDAFRGRCNVKLESGMVAQIAELDLVKVDPKELGLVPLTDTEWLGLPSTRSNYVDFSHQLPNPLLTGGWTARGRAEAAKADGKEATVTFDVMAEAHLASYVDAHVAYAEDGLKLEGRWRAADGSTGTLSGTKALAAIALGGLWHVELQSGADSMEHAWNCWFSCFPGGEGGAIRVSGAMLAGPMLGDANADALALAGEMTGKGMIKFTAEAGSGKWAGSTWDAELGPDRWLRGSWRLAGSTAQASAGRWRARHIGRKAVLATVRPSVEEGAEWIAKEGIATTVTVMPNKERLKPGAKVKLSKSYQSCGDASGGPLKPGMVGTVLQDDHSGQPYQVEATKGGTTWWYMETALKAVTEDSEAQGPTNPLGDAFEGLAFARFPVSQGSWYAEVRVERLGRTRPSLGWAVCCQEAGRTRLIRLSLIEGKGATKLDVSSPELEAGDDKESPKEDPQQTKAAEESEKKQDEDEESGESSAESSGENTEEAAKEATAKAARKDWEAAEPFGHRWQEGDVLCCAATLPGGRAAFGLNGDFEEPMGQAFDLQLPPGTQLCLVVAAGDGGRLSVNLGQVAFAHPPPTPEHRGLGEAMRIRPTWRVKLPKAVKAWPVFAGPSRQAEGRKALKDFEVVEQIELRDGWLRHEAGWSPCQMTVVSQEYDALQPIAAWQAIDRPERPKKERKAIKRTVHASFDTEFCSQNHWNFRGPEHATAAFGPAMLLSTESAATGILRWCIKSEGSNKSFEVGVIPASHSEEKNFLHETCECGVKSTGVSGGDQKSAFDIHKKYVEVIADMNERKAKFLVGDTRDQMVEMKTLDIPYEDDVRLAVTGWANVQCRLEPPRADRAAESDDSEEDDDSEGPLVTSCGNAVQANTWHVATITVDLPAGRLGVMLDGEPHLVVHDPAGLVSDGPLAIDPSEGLMLFSATRRGGGLLGEQDWRAGGHLRSLRLDHGVLSQFEIWSQHLPKGIWIGRCGARNPADARICWRCRAPRQRTGVRPPGDADPRHEGLTVVTAESFRELVLEAPRHVFVVATAAWCGACNQLKPRWARLAQLLSAEPSVTIATIDIDENELHSRHFPESFIPNAKLFILGKKRQPVTYQNVASASFEELASFLQQHTGISMQAAIERGYPAYCERLGVDRFLESIRDVALGVPIPRMPGRTGLQAMAAFFVGHLLDPEQTSVPPAPSSIDQLPLPGPPGAPLALRRTVSDAPQPTLLGPPPLLVRALSGETRAVPLSVPPAFGLGASDPSLTERLCSELLNNRLSGLLRSSQPEDPQGFARQFFLHQARPIYCHRNFFNARVWTSWQLPPRAVQFVAAVRVLRALMRWVRRRGVQLALPQWAPQTITAMSSAAHRHNWRRVEGAIMGEDPQYGLADLQLILERGFDVDAAPFGVTPLLLAAAVGNLQAVQYLFVHGANPHVEGGRPLLMPVEAAARHGHLRIVEFFIENGAVPSRALHFAAAGGATDVVAYLLRRGASPDVRIGGLSAVAVALLARQHRMVEMLIPHCRSAAISAPMPEDGCMASGIADGSTLLHLAASIGGLCELSVKELVRNGSLESVKNKRGELAFDLMAATLKAVVRPSYCCGFVHIADAGGSKARLSAVRAALANGADVAALDVRGFSLLDLACFCGDTDLAELLLEARAPVAVRGPTYPSALMWAHWRECEDIIVLLTSRGASLSNADLEGLQRLRSSWASLTSTEGDSSTNLMMPEPEHLWKGCAPSSSGFLAAAQGLAARMAWGIGQAMGPAALTSLEEVGQPEDGEPAATAALVEALGRCAAPGGLSRAALLAQRCAAEGSGLQLPDLAVLRLLATDGGFHGACSSAFAALASQQPGPGEAERAQELRPAHARLQRALRALPARKAVCYRACRLPSPSGTARELLRGSRHGLDCYRPGSVVLWRHAASATLDPALARELALRGEPAAGVGVVFKVRRAVSPRPLAELSECPEHREVVFPPGAAFRVAGLFPCTERCLRRGSSGEVEAWAAEVGAAAQAGEALSWEAACRARNVLVVLDEEDAAAAFQRIELTM